MHCACEGRTPPVGTGQDAPALHGRDVLMVQRRPSRGCGTFRTRWNAAPVLRSTRRVTTGCVVTRFEQMAQGNCRKKNSFMTTLTERCRRTSMACEPTDQI